MRSIYRGTLRKMVVSKLEVNEDEIRILEFEKPVLKEDILFYNFLGNFVSFDYSTRLPDESEAMDMIMEDLYDKPNPEVKPYPVCLFANSEEIKPYKSVTNREFRQLKKTYNRKGSN